MITSFQDVLDKYAEDFKPPVCNKVVHKNQLVAFFIHGPNRRQDFHIEEGEEIFYMIKGEMFLKVRTGSSSHVINIKQGQLFVLPKHILHSPRRPENSFGFVIERLRNIPQEYDGFRFYSDSDNDDSDRPLHEAYCHLNDLESEVKTAIVESLDHISKHTTQQMHETDRPMRALRQPHLMSPISLDEFIDQLAELSLQDQPVFCDILKNQFQSKVEVVSNCSIIDCEDKLDAILWCYRGSATIEYNGKTKTMKKDDLAVFRPMERFHLSVPKLSFVIKMRMAP